MVSFFCMKYTLSNVNKLHLNANLARHERVSQVLENTNLSSLCCIFFLVWAVGVVFHIIWGTVLGFGEVFRVLETFCVPVFLQLPHAIQLHTNALHSDLC